MKPLTTYQDYYLRPITQQLQVEKFGGLKLVVGPTGLGKTYAIPFTIQTLHKRDDFNKRFIYATHRHILLEEMERDLAKLSISSVYLKSNRELVCDFVENPDAQSFLEDLERINFFVNLNKNLKDVEFLAERIRRILKDVKYGGLSKETESEMKESLGLKCSEFLGIFESGLMYIDEGHHKKLLGSPMIWRLFPYIEFLHNPTHPVLLVTVSKLLRGFFDGRHKQRITSLKDNVIFLDEFEIQEGVILSFLCEDDGIRNNFEFVRLFYDEMKLQQQIKSLVPSPVDPPKRTEAKQSAIQLLDNIRQDCDAGKYRFPNITRFTMSEDEFRSSEITVFQSNHIVQTYPYFLIDEGMSWRIVRERSAQTLSSSKLLYLMARMADDVLEFFASLWADGLEVEWREWIDHCYNKRNDNVRGVYQDIISNYGVLRRPMKFLKLHNPGLIRSSTYYKGFNLYKLTRGKYAATLPDEVSLQQKTMHITPEYLLWQLCQSNLVFGISATGDLPRYVKTFDLKWLQDNCDYLPVDQQDTALITQMKEEKEAGRNYDIRFDLADLLPDGHTLNQYLDSLESVGFFDEGKVAVTSRRNVVSRFLETMRWIIYHSDNMAHLVFVNSFTYIMKFLDKKLIMHEGDFDDIVNSLIVQKGKTTNQEYRLMVEGKPIYVVLLNAEKARKHRLSAFQHNPQDGHLIVVTQYETAANGVNLEWTDGSDQKYDFQGIHLLEGKHFYFDHSEANDDPRSRVDADRMFIWQAWKLAEGRQISQRELKTYLSNWRINEFNSRVYKKTPDYLLNQVALFDQAFGRVDRKRDARHTTEVRLAHTSSTGSSEDGVLQIVAQYLNEEGAIGQLRDNRACYTSTLILKIHEAVKAHSQNKRVYNQFYRETIGEKQTRCREKIRALLDLIERMKHGDFSESQASMVKELWHNVREAMLRQDYQFTGRFENVQIDFQKDFVYSTAYLQSGDKILLDESQTTIFRDPSTDTCEYSLNWPYRRFKENDVISLYFDIRNYQLCYHHTTPNYIFVPHAIQAILAGGVGEAALQALLDHKDVRLENHYDYPTILFEEFDFKIKNKPIYLDAKSFSRETIYRMNAQPDSSDYNPSLNGPLLLKKAQEKWKRIVDCTGDSSTKFVIINLQMDDTGNQYWDDQLAPVKNFRESAITLVQGAINTDSPNDLCASFQLWLDDVNNFEERK